MSLSERLRLVRRMNKSAQRDPNLLYPGKDPDFVFPEEGSDLPPVDLTGSKFALEPWKMRGDWPQAAIYDRAVEECAKVADTYIRSDKTEAETALCIATAIRAKKIGGASGPKDDPEKQTLIDNDW